MEDSIESDSAPRALRTLAFLGNHTPRQCGIATFTADLRRAVLGRHPDLDALVVAMNDAGHRHAYPDCVRFEIVDTDLSAYRRAADFLNVNDVDLVSLQHEYGIFGGESGAHVLATLRALRMPVVTTLHTILAEPSPSQRLVLGEICALSERVVVMSEQGRELLVSAHRVPRSKIDLIPHGIPVLPATGASKAKLGVEGRPVLLTFGLLSPGKGIEFVIDALPAIAKHFPEVVYLVVGATHPHVRERNGETYRLMLEARAHALGVADNVVFHDRFVSDSELCQFLSAADLYLTPYLNLEQITSGTLAYALGSGKAVIATGYRYARELLADERGVLVPPRDADAIATAAIALLSNDAGRRAMELRAAAFGKTMGWPVVADAYADAFDRARRSHAQKLQRNTAATRAARRPLALPELNLEHLRAMTDDTGVLQHAAFAVPRYEDGYCLDDNARALILLTQVEEERLERPAASRALATRYLAFVRHAFDLETGHFRNFFAYSRLWIESRGSEDSHGRAIWALGTVVGRAHDAGRRAVAERLLWSALPPTLTFTSPRAWAYVLLGIAEAHRGHWADDLARPIAEALAARLLDAHARVAEEHWPWFEDRLTYANARLAQGMLAAGAILANDEMTAIGLRSLSWLATVQGADDGVFAPVGTEGFYPRNGRKAAFDHQPIEACAMVSACAEAHRLTDDLAWVRRARHAFDWFLGQNHLGAWVYDASTGGCRDGLHGDRPNENQGAESTVSFWMALMDMRRLERLVDATPEQLPLELEP